MARLMYDNRLLPTDKVIKIGGEDMVGSFVGQTKDLVSKILNDALGGVLFIDEAHRLNPKTGAGGFKQEAIGKILEAIESPEYKNKLLIVMAGYVNEVDDLIKTDQGLMRRFRKKILFRALELDASIDAFISRLKRHHNIISVDETYYRPIVEPLFKELIAREGWSSLDDIDKLVKGFDRELADKNQKLLDDAIKNDKDVEELHRQQLQEYSDIIYSKDIIERTFKRVIDSRGIKTKVIKRNTKQDNELYPTADYFNTDEKQQTVNIDKEQYDKPEPDELPVTLTGGGSGNEEDDGDIYIRQQLYTAFNNGIDDIEIEEVMKKAISNADGKKKLAEILKEKTDNLDDDYIAQKCKKLKEMKERRDKLREKRRKEMLREINNSKINMLLDDIKKEQDEEEKKKKEKKLEDQRQIVLKTMGLCPAGYQFDKVPGGYVCRGGSHKVTDDQLNSFLQN